MPFQIVRNDITKVRADVIVNTANPKPVVGSGTDSAIYTAAGYQELLAERKKIGDIAPGQAAVTPAFNLSAKHIVHTVGPAWIDGNHREKDILRSCYANSLQAAAELTVESIAFPLIATGVYGFPRDEALNIALSEIGKFLLTHDMLVILVVFDRRAFELSESLVGGIDTFIDEHGVEAAREKEYGSSVEWESASMIRRRRQEASSAHYINPLFHQVSESDEEYDVAPELAAPMALSDMEGKSLDDVLDDAGKSFQQKLFELINESGMDDISVYKKANIDRKVFSSIRCKPDYRPRKKTAVAFAIALELDLSATQDLLSRAGFALSPSDKFDLIITYFVTNGIYDIYEINAALFKYGQPILGE